MNIYAQPAHPSTPPPIHPYTPSFLHSVFKEALAELLQIQQWARLRALSSCNLHWGPLLKLMGLLYRRQKGKNFQKRQQVEGIGAKTRARTFEVE